MSLLRKAFFIVAVISGGGAIISYFFLSEMYLFPLLGTLLISFALWLDQIAIFSYHNSYYFRGLNSIIGLNEEKDIELNLTEPTRFDSATIGFLLYIIQFLQTHNRKLIVSKINPTLKKQFDEIYISDRINFES